MSTLDYYKYETINTEAGIVTFENLIKHLIKKCSAYNSIYLPYCYKFNVSDTDSYIYDKLLISEYNFTEDDKDDNMSYKDVLEEICRFFGFTCTAVGDKVIFVDYDAVRHGLNNYVVYQGINYANKTVETLSHSKVITADDYRDTGSKLSLGDVFNKVNVTNNKKLVENILPTLFEEQNLTNTISSALPYYSYSQLFGSDVYVYRSYRDKNWTNIYYNNDTDWTELKPSSIYYSTLQNTIGASWFKIATYEQSKGIIGNLSFTNYLCLHRHLQADPISTQNVIKPILKLNTDNIKPLLLCSDCYIVIDCSAMWTDRDGRMAPIEDGRDGDDYDPANFYLTAKLKIGDKYWNGTSWVTADTTFKMYFDDSDTNHYIGKWTNIKNTISWTTGIDSTGLGIPISKADNLSGKVDFILYTPQMIHHSYRIDSVWLRNLNINVKTKEVWNETDTLYTNVINESYVNELDDIDLKITSYDNKDMSYSCVAQNNSEIKKYFNNYYSSPLLKEMRPEHLLCYRYVNQYSTASKILELTLTDDVKPYSMFIETNLDSIFIVDSYSIDYEAESSSIKLVEKK